MITSSVILDLVLIAIVAVCVFFGAKRGLFRTLADLAAYLVALIGASWLANVFTAQVMEHLRPVLESQVSQSITDYLTALTENSGYSGILKGLLDTLTAGDTIDDIANVAVDVLADTVLHNMAYMLLFVVAFVLLVVALKLVIRIVDSALKLPVLHQMNTLGGVLAGALKGVLLVLLVLWLNEQTGLLVTPQALEASVVAPILLQLLPV